MKHYIGPNNPMHAQFNALAAYEARHFAYAFADGVATLTLNRPDRKNPLTFESYAELRDLFRALNSATDVKVIVLTGAGGNFCSGGDVHEIIGPLTKMSMPELLEFTRMTGDLVKAMRLCPQPIVAAIDGICAGAGAMMALAADMRLGHGAGQNRFSVYTRGPGRRRHGRLRPAAAPDRPGPRLRVAVHRPRHERAGRPGMGLFQRTARTG